MKDKNNNEENLKDILGKIIGGKIDISPRKKTIDLKRKKAFCKTIDVLMLIQNRDIILEEDFGVNLNSYNSPFFEIINALLDYSFNTTQLSLINWWLYSRINDDGSINSLIDKTTGEEINITSPDLLYMYVIGLKDA